MEDSDHFFDASDECPFYDTVCTTTTDPDRSTPPYSSSSSISYLDPQPIKSKSDVSLNYKPSSPDIPPQSDLRRRRSFSQHACRDTTISGNTNSKSSNPNSTSSVLIDVSNTGTAASNFTIPKDRKSRFSRNLKENLKESQKFESFKVRVSSAESVNSPVKEDSNEEDSGVTIANEERIDKSVAVDSRAARVDELSSSFLVALAGLVIKAIGFQVNLLVTIFTFPIWLMYSSYLFVIDPFRVVRQCRAYATRSLIRIGSGIWGTVSAFVYERFKDPKSVWKFVLQYGWGLLWSVYVCFVLVSLLLSAFLFSGFIMRSVVEEPIRMKETLDFDYTQNRPVAFLPIISCPSVSCGGVDCKEEKIDFGMVGGSRVIPLNQKLQVTVSLTLPESDYNRNLGIFQVRVDFLSVHGEALASLRRPSMLRFKSQPIHLLLTFLKIAPLVTGYSSESQTRDINFRGFTEGDIPTSCLRVIIEQRAEFKQGAGIPEIYAASVALESEHPMLKRILWNWKRTLFIWISMVIFTMEVLVGLLCCRPLFIPRVKPWVGSAYRSAPQSSHPVQS